MIGMEMRQQLHQYIESADDKNIEAIYTILQASMQQQKFSDNELKIFYDRRAEYMAGNSDTYSVEEAHNLIRQSRQK